MAPDTAAGSFPERWWVACGSYHPRPTADRGAADRMIAGIEKLGACQDLHIALLACTAAQAIARYEALSRTERALVHSQQLAARHAAETVRPPREDGL